MPIPRPAHFHNTEDSQAHLHERGTLRWRTRRTAMADAAHCDGRCSALRWQMQRTAMADAAHCDGGCGALRWQMQRTAMADAAHCDGGCGALRWQMRRTAMGREENWVERVKTAAREKLGNPRDTEDASPTCDKASARILTPPWDTPRHLSVPPILTHG